MSINILTDRERCARHCPYTATSPSPYAGDARRCEHGKWWVATGVYVRGYFGNFLDTWRRATWAERRRIRKASEQP